LGQRLATGESDLAGGAALVIDDEALQDVVYLVERHVKAQPRVPVDLGFVLEITSIVAALRLLAEWKE
jgi:hypothetical protein